MTAEIFYCLYKHGIGTSIHSPAVPECLSACLSNATGRRVLIPEVATFGTREIPKMNERTVGCEKIKSISPELETHTLRGTSDFWRTVGEVKAEETG